MGTTRSLSYVTCYVKVFYLDFLWWYIIGVPYMNEGLLPVQIKPSSSGGQAHDDFPREAFYVLKWHFRSRYVSEQSPESLKSFKQTVYI